jgi:hypothetical protein
MNRSGQGIGDIMAKTPVPLDDFKGLDTLRADAEKFATDNDKRILGNYVDELVSKADENGVINVGENGKITVAMSAPDANGRRRILGATSPGRTRNQSDGTKARRIADRR